MDAFRLDTRIGRLSPEQGDALERAMSVYDGAWVPKDGDPNFAQRLAFLLPLAEFGLSAEQMAKLILALPEGWPWDHSKVYYDFRLSRWMKHIEPPTVAECLEEYYRHSESPESALAYLRREWETFLRRHAA